ncbi:hypothetical protein Leryth_023810 [Lithospermum erythrorhizon]|nr:hypothetical protein Leryth_023810 [Lithospermum erythrorhizon]
MKKLKSLSPPSSILLSILLFNLIILLPSSFSFQSDELQLEDEEFGLEGGSSGSFPDLRTRESKSSEPDPDSKVQFSLEHSFGDGSGFSPSGVFTARLVASRHGGQTLTKLRFSRNALTETEKESFKKLLEEDDFYQIRLPSNVLNTPGKEYVISSVKARCLPRDGLDEHFVIQTDGARILGVNYGSPGSCSYPRQLKIPTKWLFNSHTILKSSEQAPRTPVFAEETGSADVEGVTVQPPEKSFWAKYWMYMLPLGFIVMNAVTQAMNMPEEQAGGPGASQPGAAAIGRGPSTVARRR